MTQDRLWELLAKKLAGEASLPELDELHELLRKSPDMHYPMQTINDLWFHQSNKTEDAVGAFDRHLARMNDMGISFGNNDNQTEPETFRSGAPGKRLVGFLALFIVAVVGGLSYYYFSLDRQPGSSASPQVAIHSEVSTRNGSRSKLMLPDGTQVWLNAGSKLTYGKEFNNERREVTLVGEAYFDVVKNTEKPFLIHARNVDIRVLGTAFNVKSYPGDKTTETSLIRGTVEVSINNRPEEKIILKPREKLVVAVDEPTLGSRVKKAVLANKPVPKVILDRISYEPADSTVIETSWMENKLIFRDESFGELARKMERWYGVEFRFEDTATEELRFTGIFEDESLQQALKALRISWNFNYRINKDVVIISK